jgi:hypothetical protein
MFKRDSKNEMNEEEFIEECNFRFVDCCALCKYVEWDRCQDGFVCTNEEVPRIEIGMFPVCGSNICDLYERDEDYK